MVQVSIEMPETLKEASEMAAKEKGYTGLSEYIRYCVREQTPDMHFYNIREEHDQKDAGLVEVSDGLHINPVAEISPSKAADLIRAVRGSSSATETLDIIERVLEQSGHDEAVGALRDVRESNNSEEVLDKVGTIMDIIDQSDRAIQD